MCSSDLIFDLPTNCTRGLGHGTRNTRKPARQTQKYAAHLHIVKDRKEKALALLPALLSLSLCARVKVRESESMTSRRSGFTWSAAALHFRTANVSANATSRMKNGLRS